MPMMVKKHMVALYVKKGGEWVRVCKSTAFDIQMNPQTQEYDYIADEIPTTELDRYQPALNIPLTMYKGEPDFEALKDQFYERRVGSDANVPILIVFRYEPLDAEDMAEATAFKAWHAPNAVLQVSDYNSVDGTLTFDANFNGGVESGYATYSDGGVEFTAGEYPDEP